MLILALASCSPEEAGNPPHQQPPENLSGNAMAVSSPFHEEFRTAYASVLWTMMVLRWCDQRWVRPKETAAAEARLSAIDDQAVKLGLKAQMDEAAQFNAQQMATMRLDVHCSGGFERFHASAEQALAKVEQLLRARQGP